MSDDVFLLLVAALHRSGALKVDDLIAEIGNSIDFEREKKTPESDYAERLEIYQALVVLQPLLTQRSELHSDLQSKLGQLIAQRRKP